MRNDHGEAEHPDLLSADLDRGGHELCTDAASVPVDERDLSVSGRGAVLGSDDATERLPGLCSQERVAGAIEPLNAAIAIEEVRGSRQLVDCLAKSDG
jgi:hypothetical protein